MSLPDEEFHAQMVEMMVVESLALEPEQHTSICCTLTILRWLKLLCKKESKLIEEITPELVIEKLSGKIIQPRDITSAKVKLSKRELVRAKNAAKHTKEKTLIVQLKL